MTGKVRTRIAPSPTGQDLHIGNVYTALINFVFAKKHQGKFVVRIEDTDRNRLVAGSEQKILNSLTWLGLIPDETVDKKGPFAPYRQSQRLAIYQQQVRKLLQSGDAYYCFCSSQRLDDLRHAQQKQGKPTMYDGKCKHIASSQAAKRAVDEPHVIRLNVPDQGITSFTDLVRGEISFENKLIDDQVLMKSDGFPTYHLAVVVDDHLMEISHVIRGEEWISSVPKHILIYQAFGWQLPKFAHVPLLRNPDKSKLSKRKNPVWTSWFRDKGFLAEALLNYLGTLAWSMPDGRDIFSVEEMINNFDLTQIKTSAPIFSLDKLSWLNGEYIRRMSERELVDRLTSFLDKSIHQDLIKALVPLARERMKTLAEFNHYIKPFIAFTPTKLDHNQRLLVRKFLELYSQLTSWQAKDLEQKSKNLLTSHNWQMRKAFMSVRLAVTGEKIGLPLFETMEILGQKEVLKRLRQAV